MDSHDHLQADVFDADRQAVIRRAVEAGVEVFQCNGSTPEDWKAVRDLASGDERIVPWFGLHPWYVEDHKNTDWLAALPALLEETPSGVGEIGLDRCIRGFDIDDQVSALRSQLGLARELRRPVTLHCLRAWGIMLEELRRFGPLDTGFILHAFGGPADMIKPLADLGAFFSFAGSILDPRRGRARESLLKVSIDRLLIETDSPDIPPPEGSRVPGQQMPDGKYRNEPANLPAILEGVAHMRGEPVEYLARSLWANGQRIMEGLR